MAENQQKVTINNKEYELDSLSEDAKNQLANIRLTDARINQLNQELAITKTARNAYAKALNDNLPE